MLANWRGVLLLFSFGHFLDNTHKLLLCVNARLGVDALDMGPNGVFRQDEVFRDVASRTSTGQIAQNLPLAPRESARSSDAFNPSFERIVDRVRIGSRSPLPPKSHQASAYQPDACSRSRYLPPNRSYAAPAACALC